MDTKGSTKKFTPPKITQSAPGVFEIVCENETRQLKVGDLICVCIYRYNYRYEHLKISTISPECWLRQPWRFMYNHTSWQWLIDFIEWLDPSDIWDLELILEYGGSHSLINSCYLVPHDWKHPSPEETALVMKRFNDDGHARWA